MKIEEIKEEFGEKFTFLNDLNQYKVGYRNRNGDDCMFGPQKVWNFIESTISQTRKEVIEENLRSFRRILDEVLISKHSNGIENVEGKDLNGSMFHYFAYKKLKELLEDLNKK
jgi:hypothetical protein